MELALTRQRPNAAKAIVAWFLLIIICPPAALSSVKIQAPLKSGPTVRLTVLLRGDPQKGVKIAIYRYELGPGQEAKPRFSLVSDGQGRVLAPRLTPGHYHVVASAPHNLTAELYLDVSQQDQGKGSEFSIELGPGGITREELFAQAERMPIQRRVSGFHGIVRDPSADPVPEVSIEVVRKGSQGRDRVAQLKSGNDGRFSARPQLSDGSYVAHFLASGFQGRFVSFEVNEQGSGDLMVTLEVGPSN